MKTISFSFTRNTRPESAMVRARIAMGKIPAIAQMRQRMEAEYSRWIGYSYEGKKWAEGNKGVLPSEAAAIIAHSTVTGTGGSLTFSLEEEPPFDRQEAESAIRRITSDATAHLLFAVLGTPADIGVAERGERDLERGIAAKYDTADDSITFLVEDQISWTEESIRSAFYHEMAHAWQARRGNALGALWAKHAVKPPTKNAGSYAHSSLVEHQAEAVASAISYIAFLGRPDTSDEARVAAGQLLDMLAPGSTLMARTLLGHPAFANHPAQAAGLDKVEFAWPEHVETSAEDRFRMLEAADARGFAGAALRTAATLRQASQANRRR